MGQQATPRQPATNRRRKTRFPGICEDASALGVNRRQLYFALTGDRSTDSYRSLLSRYEDLKAKQAAQAEAPQSAPKPHRAGKTPPPALRPLQEPLQALQEAIPSGSHTPAFSQP
jgi:hypothetical protein